MPYALLESMAAGCAVTGYGVGGVPEVVGDRSLGVLARPGDAGGLLDCIVGLVRQPGLATQIGARASTHVLRNFSLEARRGALVSAYALVSSRERTHCAMKNSSPSKTNIPSSAPTSICKKCGRIIQRLNVSDQGSTENSILRSALLQRLLDEWRVKSHYWSQVRT